MHSPLILNSRSSPRGLSKILRPIPKQKEIPFVIKQEAKEVILHGPKNRMQYYFITKESNFPEKKSPQKPDAGFKSIHTSLDSKAKRTAVEQCSPQKFNLLEKQALKEVRQKEGRLFLLSDM